MRASRIIIGGLAWMIIAMLTLPPGIPAQDYAELGQAERFKKEELTQMLAPIALYPDSLIAQILMASTYPLEVVKAERWLRQNSELEGDALDEALQEMDWEPSIKSLCHFPDVLFAMSDKLEQTRKLGDAFLSQQDDVMDTIQELRTKAQEQGNLSSTREQVVITEENVIRIEPANPRVVYVPVYDPFYVYGPWWYPAYPPYYWYYPPGVVITGGYIHFGRGFFLGIGLSSWSWFDWHRHYIHIDVHKARRFHRYDRHRRHFDRPYWRHDPSHRRGVAYRDRRTSRRFRPGLPQRPRAGPEMRGYPATRYKREVVEPSRRHVERQRGTTVPRVRAGPERSRGPVDRREVVTPRGRTHREGVRRTPGRSSPFRGIGNGNFERRAGERGFRSRRSSDIRQGSRGFKDSGRGVYRGSGRGGGSRGSGRGGFRR